MKAAGAMTTVTSGFMSKPFLLLPCFMLQIFAQASLSCCAAHRPWNLLICWSVSFSRCQSSVSTEASDHSASPSAEHEQLKAELRAEERTALSSQQRNVDVDVWELQQVKDSNVCQDGAAFCLTETFVLRSIKIKAVNQRTVQALKQKEVFLLNQLQSSSDKTSTSVYFYYSSIHSDISSGFNAKLSTTFTSLCRFTRGFRERFIAGAHLLTWIYQRASAQTETSTNTGWVELRMN